MVKRQIVGRRALKRHELNGTVWQVVEWHYTVLAWYASILWYSNVHCGIVQFWHGMLGSAKPRSVMESCKVMNQPLCPRLPNQPNISACTNDDDNEDNSDDHFDDDRP